MFKGVLSGYEKLLLQKPRQRMKKVTLTVKKIEVEKLTHNSLGLQVSFLCYVKVPTVLLFCALSPKNQLGGNATVPLTHIRLQAEYFIASLVGNLIPRISTLLNHKMFNLTSVLLYFVHFLLFFLFTLLITQLFCWVFSNEKCIDLRTNSQTTRWSKYNSALHCYCHSPERKRYFHSDFHSS